jgi:hypothetical protein
MLKDSLAARSGSGRLAGKVAVVVGAGQSASSAPNDHIVGNGRAAICSLGCLGVGGRP